MGRGLKLLLDENLPLKLRLHLVGHDVFTVRYMGWANVKNGQLLASAAAMHFDAIVTVDGGMAYQQNHATLPISIIVLMSRSNKLGDLIPLMPNLLQKLSAVTPRSVVYVA